MVRFQTLLQHPEEDEAHGIDAEVCEHMDEPGGVEVLTFLA